MEEKKWAYSWGLVLDWPMAFIVHLFGVAGTKSPLSIVQNALVVAMVICGINDFLAGIFFDDI